MQGKALTALATLLAALALAACGGGDDGGETTAGGAETSPAGGQAQLRERVDEIEKERRGESGGAKADVGEEKSGGGSDSEGSADPGERPDSSSPGQSVSGGGAGQFSGGKGGDNSIQEFGQEAGGSEMARAAAVLHAYLDARADRRWDAACSHLSAEAVAGIEQFAAAFAQEEGIEGCPEVLGVLSEKTSDEALREGARADVGSLRAQGGRGFLLYHGARGVDYAIAVVEEGGEWKIAAPEATPLP